MRTHNNKTLTIGLVVLVITVAVPATTLAFPEIWFWHHPANGQNAGAGGYYGTGSATDFGVRCSHCHVTSPGDPPPAVTAIVDAVPPFGNVGGNRGYTPGTTYRLTIRQIGDRIGLPPAMRNINGIAATIEDSNGRVAGQLRPDGVVVSPCPSAPPWGTGSSVPTRPASYAGRTTTVYGDCHAVLSLGDPGRTTWTFDWVAPAAGSGTLTLFLGLVDGGAGPRGLSSFQDDVFERSYPLHEM